jgi:protein-S-isoprenylcysteine O-methyltransferase Ste14
MASRAIRPVLHARTPALEPPAADWAFRHRDLIAGVVLVPATLVALVSTPAVPRGTALDLVCDVAAWTLFLAGAALRFWATMYIGGRKRDVIVSDGPYSLCRHPLYLASFAMTLSAGAFLASPVVVASAVIVAAIYLLTTVPQEEAVLARQHPRGWAEYAQQVPRVVPRSSGWRTPARIAVDVRSLRDEAARASRWVLMPLLAEIASHLRMQPWWPHLLSARW